LSSPIFFKNKKNGAQIPSRSLREAYSNRIEKPNGKTIRDQEGRIARQPLLSDDARLQFSKITNFSASLSKIRLLSGLKPNFNSSEKGLPRIKNTYCNSKKIVVTLKSPKTVGGPPTGGNKTYRGATSV